MSIVHINAADAAAAAEAVKREAAVRRLAGHYREAFTGEHGQAVLQDLLDHFAPDRPRFSTGTGFDPIKAAVADGQSQVTRHIFYWLDREPAAPKEETTNIT